MGSALARVASVKAHWARARKGLMIDAIEIIEVMTRRDATPGAVTIYTQVFSSDYKRR